MTRYPLGGKKLYLKIQKTRKTALKLYPLYL